MAKKRLGWRQMDKANIPLAQLLHHFEVANQTEGKSDETVKWYNNRLGVFIRWLQERQEGQLGHFNKEIVREFIRYFHSLLTGEVYKIRAEPLYTYARGKVVHLHYQWLRKGVARVQLVALPRKVH